MDIPNVVYLYSGILFSYSTNNMIESWKHYAKERRVMKGHILYESTHMKGPELANLETADKELSRVGEGGRRGNEQWLLMGKEFFWS